MLDFFPNPQTFVLFRIGSFTLDIRWYALLILIGAGCGYYFCRENVKKSRYIELSFFDDLFIYTLWVGILGARLWFCIFYNFKFYMSHPLDIIKIWDGGLAIQGGLVAGAIFVYYYCKKHHYPFMKIFDLVLYNVLIAQAIGRWGNFVNQECHGGEVSEEYFNGILSFLKNGMYIDGHYYEPLFFYESILCLLGWLIIHFILRKKQTKRGQLGYAYLVWYGTIRFFIEARRTDSLYLGNFKMAQLTSLIFIILGLLGYLGVFDKYIYKNKPTIVFDFDGTLIDTSEGIIEGYKALFKKYSSLDIFTDEVKEQVLGPALADIFPIYFPGIDYDTLYDDYHKRQFEIAKQTNKIIDNSDEILKTLHEQGFTIGILSTRMNDGIEEILGYFDLNQYVDYICGLDAVENTKPDPQGLFKIVEECKSNREVVMIGDSWMDMECGNNYGAYTIAYLDNPKRSEQLRLISNHCVTDLKEVIDIVNSDITFTYNKL